MIHALSIDNADSTLALAVEALVSESSLDDVVTMKRDERMMLPGTVLRIEWSKPESRWSNEALVLWEYLRSVVAYSINVTLPVPMDRLRYVVQNNPHLVDYVGAVFTASLGGARVRK